jgi:hypothetical protein
LIDGCNYLRNERLLCCLTEVEGELELAPNIFGSFDLGTRASRGRNKRARVGRANPRDSVGQGSVTVVRQNEAKVAVVAAPKRRGNGRGISLYLGRECLESFIRGLAMYSREQLVLKVGVVDTGYTGGHGQTREGSLSCVTTDEVNQ